MPDLFSLPNKEVHTHGPLYCKFYKKVQTLAGLVFKLQSTYSCLVPFLFKSKWSVEMLWLIEGSPKAIFRVMKKPLGFKAL